MSRNLTPSFAVTLAALGATLAAARWWRHRDPDRGFPLREVARVAGAALGTVTIPVDGSTDGAPTVGPDGTADTRAPQRGLRGFWRLLVDSVWSWIEDFAPSMGAAISYYTLFSLAPLLLIIVSVAGLVFGEEAARGEVFAQIEGLLGADGASATQDLLRSVETSGKGTLGSVTGIVLLAIGATTVFAELQSALDRIWRSPRQKQPGGVWGTIRSRLLSFGLILALGFLLIVSLVVSAALSALGTWWAPAFGAWETLAQAANFGFSFAVLTAIFALIYKWMPSVDIAWRDVILGSAVTALLFTIGKLAIGVYIGTSGIASGFGAASSIVVVLVWVYYSAQIFLLGAEFTWVYAQRYGSRRPARPER